MNEDCSDKALELISTIFSNTNFAEEDVQELEEDYIIIGLFSLLALHDVILYIALYLRIPPMKFFIVPIIFIASAFVFVYKMIYRADTTKAK